MTKKQKHSLYRIMAGVVFFIILALLKPEGFTRFILFMIPYLTVGLPVLKKAAVNILHGQVFDENFLMCLATIGANLYRRISRSRICNAFLSDRRPF